MSTMKRYTKKWDVLINPSWDQEISRESLLAFSFALSTRNNQLTTIADEILDLLDDGISAQQIDGQNVTRAGILIWLWTLGAYEIVRTMCQAKSCFSKNLLRTSSIIEKETCKDQNA